MWSQTFARTLLGIQPDRDINDYAEFAGRVYPTQADRDVTRCASAASHAGVSRILPTWIAYVIDEERSFAISTRIT
jgi:hypothetical protein